MAVRSLSICARWPCAPFYLRPVAVRPGGAPGGRLVRWGSRTGARWPGRAPGGRGPVAVARWPWPGGRFSPEGRGPNGLHPRQTAIRLALYRLSGLFKLASNNLEKIGRFPPCQFDKSGERGKLPIDKGKQTQRNARGHSYDDSYPFSGWRDCCGLRSDTSGFAPNVLRVAPMRTIKRVLRVLRAVVSPDREKVERNRIRRSLRKLYARRGFRPCGQ